MLASTASSCIMNKNTGSSWNTRSSTTAAATLRIKEEAPTSSDGEELHQHTISKPLTNTGLSIKEEQMEENTEQSTTTPMPNTTIKTEAYTFESSMINPSNTSSAPAAGNVQFGE